ncbi:hypothetical protein PsYK624_034770 [Phanerochaete sordida]|uniref:Uncharacterized protein n=1 Tax=Phanerochaete sordida TaxID=48140 RepID=A0A9P3G4F1_9APHY|nr:hypothetical protein PsYK624_034770 [Phanerochaete sordida]
MHSKDRNCTVQFMERNFDPAFWAVESRCGRGRQTEGQGMRVWLEVNRIFPTSGIQPHSLGAVRRLQSASWY